MTTFTLAIKSCLSVLKSNVSFSFSDAEKKKAQEEEEEEEAPCEEVISQKEATPPNKKKPWLTLVSYVDEITVGGRRDSQGNYVDGIGNFPGFGYNKPEKVPEDCFPQHCYQRWVNQVRLKYHVGLMEVLISCTKLF